FESELFGHAKGAFTGAHEARAGAFRRAEGGTLFLDEMTELPLEGQAKLLRALEAGRVRPLGESDEVPVDVRVLAATNRSLRACVDEGSFREDLFYRLAVFRLRVPALRERAGDLPLLVDRILADLALAGSPAAGVSSEGLQALAGRSWPGNVRELRN
ncbi:MAG TPA: sigma-54-dependent Fis family transcriptional regulator, partial [Planctomycetes bacterium]|nr:sigma-54-dependent Fis family transcriptional regulator [Planctomycetota bacterium]